MSLKMVVWKFENLKVGLNEIELPKTYKPIAYGFQGDKPVMWAIVDPEAQKVKRSFLLAETGKEYDFASAEHIGTAQFVKEDGSFRVFHLFEVLT